MEHQNKTQRALQIIKILRQATKNMVPPMSETIKLEYGNDPFLMLISCLLSLRSRDVITLVVSRDLFAVAQTPQELLALPTPQLEKIIYKTGFYKRKAEQLKHVSAVLIEQYNAQVPATKEELMSIKGIGSKTANLVLGQAFNIPAICVDTHVHRISNRLGLVITKTPQQTELELEKILPKEYWIEWNRLMVMWGQNICVPISPFCSRCAIADICPKIDVKNRR